jgi:hypothetical protein
MTTKSKKSTISPQEAFGSETPVAPSLSPATRQPEPKKDGVPEIKKIIGKELEAMEEIVREMEGTNVVSYPLKYVVLRRWFEGLWETHDNLRRLLDPEYHREY